MPVPVSVTSSLPAAMVEVAPSAYRRVSPASQSALWSYSASLASLAPPAAADVPWSRHGNRGGVSLTMAGHGELARLEERGSTRPRDAWAKLGVLEWGRSRSDYWYMRAAAAAGLEAILELATSLQRG